MTDDGILMEYVDGETLTQRLTDQPNYFKNKSNPVRYIDDSNLLEESLSKALNDEEYIKALAIDGIETAKNNHNQTINSKKIYKILSEIK